MKIRVVKTASKANAVQVVCYQNNKRIVLHHIGSAHTAEALSDLMILAEEWIKDYARQLSIFPDENPNRLLHLNHSTFIGIKYRFFHKQVRTLQDMIELDELPALLNDLVAIRIFEPASKLRSLELMEQYFGICHSRKTYYKIAPDCINLKKTVEQKVVNFAKVHYSFNFDILFYDVTTLYFETFEEDELRKNGFSKDNKSQQPQILIALMVSKEGFPVAYEVFSGNTFEGHTITPVIKDFIERNGVKAFTVVADAAMISSENIQQLTQNNINYIVGARLGNIPAALLETIDKTISREDGKSIRVKTHNGYLVCSYSSVRYRKDKYEMDKQFEKAKQVIEKPSKNKKLKFTQTKEQKIELNQAMIEKTKKLLGIKGYYTNLEASVADNQTIIERYHELYKIEQAFRISKNDLQTRPIFHFKEEPIKLHILICFMALVVSKHIELKTGISNELPRSRADEVSKQRQLLTMYFLVFFFLTLCLNICLYRIFIPMPTHCINIKTLCPKLPSPKFFLYFWMQSENLLRCNTFYRLNNPRRTQHWNTLNQKMNMILIAPNLYKCNFISLGYFNANILQTLFNRLSKNYSSVFGWAYKMIQ